MKTIELNRKEVNLTKVLSKVIKNGGNSRVDCNGIRYYVELQKLGMNQDGEEVLVFSYNNIDADFVEVLVSEIK
jgi:hypothetical protein